MALASVMNPVGTLPLAPRQPRLLVSAASFTNAAAVRLGCQFGAVEGRVSRARNVVVAGLDPTMTLPGNHKVVRRAEPIL